MDNRATASLIFAAVLVVAIAGVWVALSEATVTGNTHLTPKKLPSPIKCTSDAQCSDNNECTADKCTPNGCTRVNYNDCSTCSFGFCYGGKCVSPAAIPYCSPTPSPSPSPSPYSTPEPQSPFPTPSPSLFPTPSPSPYPTASPSPFPTESPSPYPTESPSPSPFPTPTVEPCERMKRIMAVSGFFMKNCKFMFVPGEGWQFTIGGEFGF